MGRWLLIKFLSTDLFFARLSIPWSIGEKVIGPQIKMKFAAFNSAQCNVSVE